MIRRIATAVTGAIVLAGMTAAGATAAPSPCAGASQRCDATIQVPLNWLDPNSAKMTLPYEFVPHSDRSKPAKGTIVGLDGGPGSILVDSNSVPGFSKALGPLLASYDLLVVERRGFGAPDALQCNGLTIADPASITACAKQPQAQFDNTAQRVRDVDAVRASLGIDKLILYGNSYGGIDGPAYATRFPQHTAAAIFDSPSVPVDAKTGYAQDYVNFQYSETDAIKALDRACAPSASCRALPGTTAERVSRLADLMRAHPDPALSFMDLLSTMRVGPFQAEQANGAIAAYLAGDEAPLHRLAAVVGPPGGAKPNPGNALPTGPGYLAYFCNDFAFPYDKSASPAIRKQQLADYRKAHPEHPITSAEISGGYGYIDDWCTNWTTKGQAEPPAPANAQYPNIPVLSLAGSLDGGTLDSARQLAGRFPHGQVLDVPFGYHATSLSTSDYQPCVDAAIQSFIEDPLAPVNTRCDGENFRAIGNFPRTAAELPKTATPGLTAAFYTAADALAPTNPNWSFFPPQLPGVRGGTINIDAAHNKSTLNNDHYIGDIGFSGNITRSGNTATAALTSTNGGQFTFSWPAYQAGPWAKVNGTANGTPFATVLPATT